jgi:uncharacterized protein involved in outer membrane biogenesis
VTEIWRARLHRWRWWLVALGILLVIRAALPEILRRVIVGQASEALNARVDVGDVDLRLWRGGVALEDVAVREKGAPDPPPPPEEADPNAPPPPAFDQYSPLISFKRFAIELRYLPLFSKIIQLREIAIASPRVAVERLASGDLNVMALVPKQSAAVEAGDAPPPPPTPAAEGDGGGWAFGLDKFELTDGRVRFLDLALAESEPVDLGIDRIAVNEIALTPAVYGKPATIALTLGVDEGVVDVTANLTLDGSKVNVTTNVRANRLPLRRARLYVPKVGWSDLRGELDLDLTYELEEEKTNALHGSVGLRDVSVAVPSLEDVAVKWKSLTVAVERIDLLTQRAAVQEIALDGAVVSVRVEADDPLPVLSQKKAAARATGAAAPPTVTSGGPEQPSPTPTDTPESVPPSETPTDTPSETPTATPTSEGSPAAPADGAEAEEEKPRPPWQWQLAKLGITNSTVRVLSDQPPLAIGVDLAATQLSGTADAIAHVTLGLAIEQGTVTLDGDLRIADTPAFGGTLKIADLALPPLVAISGALPPAAFPSGTLRSDLAIAAGLPSAAGGEASADLLRLSGTLGVAALQLAPPQAPGLTVALADVALQLNQVSVPGVIPPGRQAPVGAAIDLAAVLTLEAPQVAQSGEQTISAAAQRIVLEVPGLNVPASLATLAPGDGVPIVSGGLGLELAEPRVSLNADATAVQAQRIALKVTDAQLPVRPPPAAPAAAAPVDAAALASPSPAAALEPTPMPDALAAAAPIAAPPARLALQLDLAAPKVTTVQGKELAAGAASIAVTLTDVIVPGFVAGAPLAPSNEPLQAKATVQLVQPRVARGDGKEFAVSAKSISVPVQSLSLPGVPGGIPPGAAVQPLRATLGEVRLEGPAIRVTRTKAGIVLPASGAAPAAASSQAVSPSPTAQPTPAVPPSPGSEPSPAAGQPLELQIAAVRILRGGVDFTDRAVEPSVSTRLAPIEVDARGIKLPGPYVKPLSVDITNVEQGKITVRGDLSPNESTITLKVDEWALAPYNAYATTYSPYGIADGALTIDLKADAHDGTYEVKNDIRLHQFDLSGAEGDSLFEQNFGIPLSLALALLRDVQGNIDLAVPLQVDREGNAQVDVMAVVRSALRQAITGAVTSPLKMLGAVAGGTGAPIAPSPIAFRLGRAEPTGPGTESAARLAAFLASRPAMGVQLTSAATADDARWLHEQALLATWADEGVFARSLAFVVERGPRQRIRDYLEARIADQKPELSAEDAAQLDEWLTEIPPPTPEQLTALAAARLAAVQTILRDKAIDAARVTVGPPPEDATKPIVAIQLRSAANAS